MVYTVTDTAEPVAHHLVASAPKINNAPHTNVIQFERNLELVTNAALVSAIERLGHFHAAKAMKARGISSHQLAQFRHWEKGAAKLSDHRTFASYTQHRNIIASIDRRWDGAITTARIGLDRATNYLAVATADLLSTMPVALASELTDLSVRRLSTIVRAVANTHSAPATRMVQRH